MRDFSLALAELFFGTLLFAFGLIFGGWHWIDSILTGQTATIGTVMVATLPVILGFQLIIGFLAFDMQNEPRHSLRKQPGYTPPNDRHIDHQNDINHQNKSAPHQDSRHHTIPQSDPNRRQNQRDKRDSPTKLL